jgi:sarcosine oxidase subunit gamma
MQPSAQSSLAHSGDGVQALASAGIVDLSGLARCGVKGPGAAGALKALGVAVPADPNRWVELDDGGLVARLGRSEFLIEDAYSGSSVRRVRTALDNGAPGVYPVPRYDLALVLVGARMAELWEQTCSFDLREFEALPGLVVLAQMIGVSVTALRTDFGERVGLRIWCDGTFGAYFHATLLEIARELGGGAADADDLFASTRRLHAV